MTTDYDILTRTLLSSWLAITFKHFLLQLSYYVILKRTFVIGRIREMMKNTYGRDELPMKSAMGLDPMKISMERKTSTSWSLSMKMKIMILNLKPIWNRHSWTVLYILMNVSVFGSNLEWVFSGGNWYDFIMTIACKLKMNWDSQ